MSEDSTNRIKYALYSESWDAQIESPSELRRLARRVLANEYVDAMHGAIYCPGCFTALTRTPREKPFFANGRRACFAHLPTNRSIPCDLRSTRPEGKLFLTEEEAARAIANDELVVVSSFLSSRPEAPESSGVYDQTPVEDLTGPVSEVPIARHRDRTFRLPTRVSTIASLCRRFDENLYRYYVLPGSSEAVRLVDALTNVADVTEPTSAPSLYFGEIVATFNAGKSPKPTNIRMTQLRCNAGIADFYLKVKDQLQAEKGITDQAVGRYVLFWGKISVSGIGLSADHLGWGEFSLLPQKYEAYLPQGET